MDDLCGIMHQSGGELGVDTVDLAVVSYEDLGYDSLARLEVTARIKQLVEVQVPDEAVAATSTPASTVAAVNSLLLRGVAA
jgi:act minimal PKS acyl carrier protein